MATTAQVLTSMQERMARQDAVLAALMEKIVGPVATSALVAAQEEPEAPALVAEPAVVPVASVTAVQGTVLWVAKSGNGVQMKDSKAWYYRAKGSDLALPAKGAQVTLYLDADGKLIGFEGLTAPTPPTTAPKAATPPVAQAPVAAPPAPAAPAQEAPLTVGCPLCSGPQHGKDAGEKVARDCAARQYTNTGAKLSVLAPETFAAFGAWLACTRVVVFANTKDGKALISKGATAPAAPAQAPVATPPTPAPVADSDALVAAAAQQIADGSRVGTYTALVAKQSRDTPGLVKLVSTDMPRAKTTGDWLKSVMPDVVATILKAELNDRVSFVLKGTGKDERIVGFRIMGTAQAETGAVQGVQTSGKQLPAAPKPQGTDPKVKAARTARKAAAKSTTVDKTPAVDQTPSKPAVREHCIICEKRFTMAGRGKLNPMLCTGCENDMIEAAKVKAGLKVG